MSQRARPPMIMQPMLALGDLNAARWSIGAGVDVVDEVVLGTLVELVVAVVFELELTIDAVVTVTVFVDPDPQALSTVQANAMGSQRFSIVGSLSAPSVELRCVG